MAVLIQAFSVVVRRATLDAKYVGGSIGYQRDCPNDTFCADEHLCRIGFMAQRDAEIFVAHLAAKGLTPSRGGAAEDAVIVDAEKGLLRPCPWLVFGRLGNWAIAWLAGAPQGELHAHQGWNADAEMQYISAEEMQRRFEFVRAEDGVDVYRDKTTGRQLYVGRAFAEPADSSSRHAELYQQACKLIEGLLVVGNEEPGRLRRRDRKRLQNAASLFFEVLELNPEGWPAMWLLGKIYQRLGDHAASLAWFSRAHRVNPDHPDVAREAAIAAMDLGRPNDAVGFCERAIEASPDDAGLHANLALALLFSQRPVEAQVVVHDALTRDPADEVTRNLAAIIEDVLRGKRRCPRHVGELQC
jgi:Flp pilus assembly protein TadD